MGPAFFILCALHDILSFRTLYAVQPFIDLKGRDKVFLACGILTGVVGGLRLTVYLFQHVYRSILLPVYREDE